MTLEKVAPETVGLSGARLARVDAWLQHQIEAEKLAGASVLVGRQGQVAYFGAAGVADLDTAQPFAEGTIVRIYSMTKAVTSVAAMMLFDQVTHGTMASW